MKTRMGWLSRAAALLFALTLFASGGVLAADVPSDWAADEVKTAVALGLVPESLQKNYQSPVTRAEFASLVMRLQAVWDEEGMCGVRSEELQALDLSAVVFTDTDDRDVRRCAALGIVEGVGENRFAPEEPLTRQQAAAMLYRACGVLAPWVTTEDTMGTTQVRGFVSFWMPHCFADGDAIRSWARTGIQWCYRHNVMAGVDGDRFAPEGGYTREQAILTVLRLYYVNGRAGESPLCNAPDVYPVFESEAMDAAAFWLNSALETQETTENAEIAAQEIRDGTVTLGGGAYAVQEDANRIRVFDAFGDTLAEIDAGSALTLLGSSNGLVYARDVGTGEDVYYTQTGSVAFRY